MIESHDMSREKIKKTQTAVKCARNNKNTLLTWFQGWQVHASEIKDTRLRTEHLKQALRARAGSKALRKWQMRAQITVKMRNFFRKGKFVKKQMNLKSCFGAWKRENANERNFSNKIRAFMESMQNINEQMAFDLIKRYAQERHTRKGKNKQKAQAVLVRAFSGFNEFKLRSYFNKMR